MNTLLRHIILFSGIFAILTIALLLPGGAQTSYADSPTTLTIEKTVVPEGEEFSTLVLGLPWNLNSNPYPDYFTALKSVDENKFKVTNDGFWNLYTTTSDPHFWLNWSGIEYTQRVLRMGDSRPVDTDKYKLLSYYMCLEKAPKTTGEHNTWASNIYWMYDRRPHVNPKNGISNFIFFVQQGLFKNDGDCELITVDLSNPAVWMQGEWKNDPNMPQGFRLDFFNQPGANIQLGWVRLTTIDLNNSVPLTWRNAAPGQVNFYASLKGCDIAGIKIGFANASQSSGTFRWGEALQPDYSDAYPLPIPESFEPGEYFVYMKDSSGKTTCSSTKLTIHQAPILEFLKPSFFSGPDYATLDMNDPWGMSNSGDLSNYRNITNPAFNNGVMTAANLTNDPSIMFNVGTPIDTAKFRYVTVRMRINAPNKEGDDLVQRFFWWTKGEGIDHKVTEDMEIYEGWHTYSLDLTKSLVEKCGFNCWFGNPTGLRMDPHESWTRHQFQVDFLTLTGMDTVVRGDPGSIKYIVPNAPNAKVTFYYDTDRDPENGLTLLPGYAPDAALNSTAAMPFKMMIPIASRFGELNLFPNALTYAWDSARAAQATFYIAAVVDDGIMKTTWYSEVPVMIK